MVAIAKYIPSLQFFFITFHFAAKLHLFSFTFAVRHDVLQLTGGSNTDKVLASIEVVVILIPNMRALEKYAVLITTLHVKNDCWKYSFFLISNFNLNSLFFRYFSARTFCCGLR